MSNDATKERDFFTDRSVLLDPYLWLDESREKGRVRKLDSRDVLMVTGFAEASEVLLNRDTFSSAIAAAGPTAPLPFEPQGGDITEQIAEHHHKFVGSEQFISYDGSRHTASRSLLRSLFMPSRLRANEEYMRELADRMVGGAVSKGQSEIISELATPYVTLVIGDLLGVPAEDRAILFEGVTSGPQPGSIDDADAGSSLMQIAQQIGKLFFGYIEDRRANPQRRVDRAGERGIPGRFGPDDSGTRDAGGLPVRCWPGHQREAAGQRDPLSGREHGDAGHIARISRQNPRIHRRDAAAGRIDQGYVPGSPQGHPHRRCGRSSRNARRILAGWCEPRSSALGRSSRFRAGAPEDHGTSGLRPRCAYLHWGGAGTRRGARNPRTTARPDLTHCAVRGPSRAARKARAAL